jgi:dihydrofolate reductase
MARKVSAHLFNSVNGVVESPNEWQFDRFGTEEMEMMGAAIGGVTDVVIGRKLWDEWSEYWQTVGPDDPFGQFINPVRKHVVSSTRSGDLGWNSTVIEGDPAAHVRALKETDGGGISVVGGIDTTRSLFLAGVIDELTLTTHPVAGVGRRLFDETVPVTRLDLVRSQVTSVGNAVLTYALRKA